MAEQRVYTPSIQRPLCARLRLSGHYFPAPESEIATPDNRCAFCGMPRRTLRILQRQTGVEVELDD